MAVGTSEAISGLLRSLLLHALRVTDARLNDIAMKLLRHTGSAFHRDLIDGALDIKNRPKHRARLLKAVAGTRVELEGEVFIDVWSLLNDRYAEVRVAAADMIYANPELRAAASAERAAVSAAGPLDEG